MSFDRKGKCPICHKPFQSTQCPHSSDYVHKVVTAARRGENFERDVKKVAGIMKRKGRNWP